MVWRVLVLLLMLWCAAPLAVAGVASPDAVEGDPPACEGACRAVVTDAVADYFNTVVPVLGSPAETFEAANAAACASRDGEGPQVFGILIAPDYQPPLTLAGAVNDTRLLKQVMVERGVAAGSIHVLAGRVVTRADMLTTLGDVLSCLRERDQVIVEFSGQSTYHTWDYFAGAWFEEQQCAKPGEDEAVKTACMMATADSRSDPQAADMFLAISEAFRTAVQPYDQLLLFDSSVQLDENSGLKTASGLATADLSNFVTRVRNRGADAFVIIDTNHAGAADLLSWQRDAAVPPGWSSDGDTIVTNNGLPDPVAAQSENGTVPLFGSGEFAAFYATDANKVATENDQQGQGVFGAFSFQMAEALRGNDRITFRDIALAVSTAFKDQDAQTPVFQASNADLAVLAPRAAAPPPDDRSIEIIAPAPKRGAAGIEEKTFTLVARYSGKAKAYKAIVDGDVVDIDRNGQFRKEITDTGGKLSLGIRVLSPSLATLAATTVKLREAGDEAAIPPVIGRKVALIIANEAYQSADFPALKTPIADARAVADVLIKKYGFVTELGEGNVAFDLFMTNVTKAQIQQVLFELRRRLTAEDQLLVYYAGHGESDPDLGAYWVPVDGVAKEDFTWLAADEITRELKRMNAISVLVVSDSCYAGGLSRGGAAEPMPASSEARDRWLAKSARLKARQLLASGGNEPVSDTGGSGHSVFAKALLDALDSMPENTFTAGELFEQKVKPAVISAANALTEGQTPGFARIGRAGDEPGSEFVFQAAAAAP